MEKFMTARQAIDLIKDGDLLAVNGMGQIAAPTLLFDTLEQRYLETGHPQNIGFYALAGMGAGQEWKLANRLAHPGLISLMIIGHWGTYRCFFDAIVKNNIEAYNLPQGVLSLNLHMAAANRPGFYSRMGLKTLIDPRLDGGALNDISKRTFSEVVTIDGKEYLYYKTIKPTICALRGTTADPNGNITFEKEACWLDPLAMAMATKNNGGKVIVQVERISAYPANPHHVRVPGRLVDAIYTDPEQNQTDAERYNALYSGERKCTPEDLDIEIQAMLKRNTEGQFKYTETDRVIARRAVLELKDDDIINLGAGIPMIIAMEAQQMGLLRKSMTFTVESGTMGGIPVGDIVFGAAINVEAIYDQTSQFEFYEGGGLSVTFVGALEIDEKGNVNVARKGKRIFGMGGFNFVTQTPKRVVFCSKFQIASEVKIEDGRPVFYDGTGDKFCKGVESISLSADFALEEGQDIIYITERAMFKLTHAGLELIEIAPGLDVERDVILKMAFRPKVSSHLKIYPKVCYEFTKIL